MCLCICICSMCIRNLWRTEEELQIPNMRVLGTEPGPSARAVNTSNPLTISSSSKWFLFHTYLIPAGYKMLSVLILLDCFYSFLSVLLVSPSLSELLIMSFGQLSLYNEALSQTKQTTSVTL